MDTTPEIERAPADSVGPTRRRRRPLVIAAAVVATLALVVAACGEDGDAADGVASLDGSDAAEDASAAGDDDGDGGEEMSMEDAALAFAECMREHGVDMPDPQFQDGGGVVIGRQDAGDGPSRTPGPGDSDFDAAQEECSPIMEAARGEAHPPSPEEVAELQDRFTALAECMRARGHDMPDPQIDSDGRVSMQMRSDADAQTDPEQLRQDQQECNEEAGLESGPAIGPGPGEEGQ